MSYKLYNGVVVSYWARKARSKSSWPVVFGGAIFTLRLTAPTAAAPIANVDRARVGGCHRVVNKGQEYDAYTITYLFDRLQPK